MGFFDFLLFCAIANCGNKRREYNSGSCDNEVYDNRDEDGYLDSCEDNNCDFDPYSCDDGSDFDW